MHKSYKNDYNHATEKYLAPGKDMNNLCKAITVVGKEVLIREDTANPGWFESNKNDFLLIISAQNKILIVARSSNDCALKQKCINARNNIKYIVKTVKSSCISILAD